jgi:hypothetical protein
MHWLLVVPLLANQTLEGLATALCQAAESQAAENLLPQAWSVMPMPPTKCHPIPSLGPPWQP